MSTKRIFVFLITTTFFISSLVLYRTASGVKFPADSIVKIFSSTKFEWQRKTYADVKAGDEFIVQNRLYRHSQKGKSSLRSNLKVDDIEKLTYVFNRDNQGPPTLNDIVYVLDIPNLQTVKNSIHKGHWRIPQTDYNYVVFQGIVWHVTREDRRVILKKTRLSLSKVLAIHTEVHTDDILEVELTLTDDPRRTHRVITTAEHPFYVAQNQAYIPTKAISAGHQLLSLKGPRQVLDITKTPQRGSKPMYNLSLSNPNYYIRSGTHGGLKGGFQTEFNVHNMRSARRLGQFIINSWENLIEPAHKTYEPVRRGCPSFEDTQGITEGVGAHGVMGHKLAANLIGLNVLDDDDVVEKIRNFHAGVARRYQAFLTKFPNRYHITDDEVITVQDMNINGTGNGNVVVLPFDRTFQGIADINVVTTPGAVVADGKIWTRGFPFGETKKCDDCKVQYPPGSMLFRRIGANRWSTQYAGFMLLKEL